MPPNIYDWGGTIAGAGMGAAKATDDDKDPWLGALIGAGSALSKREPKIATPGDYLPYVGAGILVAGVVAVVVFAVVLKS